MTPTIWVTPNKNSQVVCSAVHRATGFPMKQVHDAPPSPGPSIVYGLLRGCSEIIQRCEASGNPYWHIDHGYFRRSEPEKFDGYYRISKNGLSTGTRPHDWEATGDRGERWLALGIRPKPMADRSGPVLICPPTIPIAAHYGINPRQWVEDVSNFHKLAGRDVEVREKGNAEPVNEAINRASLIFAFNSNIVIDALVAGVQARHAKGPAVGGVSDRVMFFWWLANNQWRLDEISPEIFL